MKRDELIAYLDETLRVKEIEDSSQNGLQVEGPDISRPYLTAMRVARLSKGRICATL